MAQLKEGSIIRKSTGDEIIATINDLYGIAGKDGEQGIQVLRGNDGARLTRALFYLSL